MLAIAGCSAPPAPAELVEASPPHEKPFAHPFSAEALAIVLSMANLGEPPLDPTNAVADDPRAAHFGRYLFFDKRLSATGEVSCATCHDPSRSWSDGRALAQGIGPLTRHTPSLWNVAYNRWFFWDGRADSLWSQALGPLENELEHGSSRLQLAHLVDDDPELKAAYEGIFGPLPELEDERRFPRAGRPVPDDPTHPHHVAWTSMSDEDRAAVDRVFANLGKCIAAFERKLVSRGSAFDRYAAALRRGDATRPADFPDEAVRGLDLFLGKGQCRNCHHGPNFTDKEFHNTLLPIRTGVLTPDSGRMDGARHLLADPFNGVGAYSDDPSGEAEAKIRSLWIHGEDHGTFKTPTLRNVAATAPYMHQGQLETLEEVVRFYSRLDAMPATPLHHPDPLMQPRNLSEGEIADLVAFLRTLTDERLPPELFGPPKSPVLATSGVGQAR